MAGSELLTLAHISDLHLPTIGGFGPRHWSLKRILGYINWQQGRKRSFSRAVVDALVNDIVEQRPDHIALTGDLVNLGLPSELEAASGFLEDVGPPDSVSVVPGNHDIYVRLQSDPGVERWRDYMSSESAGRNMMDGLPEQFGGFPYVRKVGPIGLIGLNSSLPMPPFIAAGMLGGQQLTTLEQLLVRMKDQGLIRVILIHHPPLVSLAPWRRGLQDAKLFEDVLARSGAELVLHGHNHTNTLDWTKGAGGPVPVVGIAAGGMCRSRNGHHDLARYNLMRFLNDAGMLRIELVGRGLSVDGGPVVEVERKMLSTQFALS